MGSLSRLDLARLTIDSTTIEPGCEEFWVASMAQQLVTVDGVTTCLTDADCPPPQVCRANLMTCG